MEVVWKTPIIEELNALRYQALRTQREIEFVRLEKREWDELMAALSPSMLLGTDWQPKDGTCTVMGITIKGPAPE